MNASTADHRAWFTSHRQRIHSLLEKGNAGGRLCVLGAGNCNDLDLAELSRRFDDIQLVDLDSAATRAAVGPLALSNVAVHAPVDITGIAAIISSWTMPRPSDAAIEHALRLAETGGGLATSLRSLEGTCDVVLSPCVLSQLIVSVRGVLGPQHLRFARFRTALQVGHARLMTRLLKPGGRAVLLVDPVSSERADRLPRLRPHETAQAMAAWIEQGLHLPGLDPATIAGVLRKVTPNGGVTVASDNPWLWKLGPLKAFLVYACEWRSGSSSNASSPAVCSNCAVFLQSPPLSED